MKQVLNVGIGGRSFVIDEDAFDRLNSYLNAFRSKTGMGYQTKEVMDDLEPDRRWWTSPWWSGSSPSSVCLTALICPEIQDAMEAEELKTVTTTGIPVRKTDL